MLASHHSYHPALFDAPDFVPHGQSGSSFATTAELSPPLRPSWTTSRPIMSATGAGGPSNANNNPQPRQIRFVSNDGQPHAKRRRINAACKTCRKRKTRCSGERPTCETCRQNGHACMGYVEPGQRQTSPNLESQANRGDETDHESNDDSRPSPDKSGSYSPVQRRGRGGSDSVASATGTPVLTQHNSDSSASQMSHHSNSGNLPPINEHDAPPPSLPDEAISPKTNTSPRGQQGPDHRVPYFRYFGPTAIVPGFKQMVVQVKEHRRSTGAQSLSAVDSPGSGFTGQGGVSTTIYGTARTPSQSGTEPKTTMELPAYDPSDPMPNSPLITHLVETFFTHLGCNFPFLQRERFLKDVEDKRVDAILVDAVCAMSARFSTHPLLTTPNTHTTPEESVAADVAKSEYGQPFAQRAKNAVARTFSCPSVAVVQACLLLAYEEFGSNHDSGLWMYLGIAIRMAQDLGMNKLEGMRYEGREGPTPKSAKLGDSEKTESSSKDQNTERKHSNDRDSPMIESQKAAEKERVDTFWAVFFLDRVISSGTGRPVTLRDKDVELSFPSQEETDSDTGYPPPFPVLIRIIHLYGRVTDLLNNIKEVRHVTPETLRRLAGMEKDLTGIYQCLSPALHFNVVNFQHYVKVQQGTNFILLHFWFHTLIVLLHQPTLLHSFEGRIQQLFPNSRELSMSSAKTTADILTFAELLDAKSFIGNPFTSQPMYIAACAFLMESAAHTASDPASRNTTPPLAPRSTRSSMESGDRPPSSNEGHGPLLKGNALLNASKAAVSVDSKAAKHTLLATAANQNYQRCYKALKSLETYWAGTKYIVTVLDQKMKGIGDPLLYTTEEMESSLELPNPEPAFTTPGWRRKPSLGLGGSSTSSLSHSRGKESIYGSEMASPKIDWSQAFGWSLTGTTNSPNSNLTFLYQTSNGENASSSEMPQQPFNPANANLPLEAASATANAARALRSPSTAYSDMGAPPMPQYPKAHDMSQPHPQAHSNLQHLGISGHHSSNLAKYPTMSSDQAPTSDPEMLLNLNSPYATNSNPSIGTSQLPSTRSGAFDEAPASHTHTPASHRDVYDYAGPPQPTADASSLGFFPSGASPMTGQFIPGQDMMIESQDVDMNALGDIMNGPWILEYLPQDMLNYFDTAATAEGGTGQVAQGVLPPGPPPPPATRNPGDPNAGGMAASGGPPPRSGPSRQPR